MTPADLDQLARDVGAQPVLPPPGDEAEEWISVEERLRLARERELRRGYLVAILARVALLALLIGAGVLLLVLLVMRTGGWP